MPDSAFVDSLPADLRDLAKQHLCRKGQQAARHVDSDMMLHIDPV